MDCNNVPIGAIQRILSHENRTTTEIYLHGIGEMEKAAIAVYEHARQNSHTDSHTKIQRGSDPDFGTPFKYANSRINNGAGDGI